MVQSKTKTKGKGKADNATTARVELLVSKVVIQSPKTKTSTNTSAKTRTAKKQAGKTSTGKKRT